MTAPAARLLDVSRSYGAIVALDHVSLNIDPGLVLGLLGPNGAGKSTLINLVCGLRRPTSGQVELLGGAPQEAGRRRGLGLAPQQTGLPETLRVREVVDFVSRHYPAPLPAGELLERFGLTGLERRQTGSLSGGQQRRLAVSLAFLGRPRLVLLDEPTTGLVDRLCRQDYVRRTPDPADRRRILISVNTEARSDFTDAFAGLARAMGDLVAKYDDTELAVITDYVTNTIDILHAETQRLGSPGDGSTSTGE